MRRAFSVSVFCRHDAAVLLVRHRRLGRWLPVGGELEPGETPLEAARRELREETALDGAFPEGLGVDGTPPGLIGYEEHTAGTKGLHLNFAFVADVASRDLLPCDEWDDARWVDVEGAVALDAPANVYALVRLALEAPRGRVGSGSSGASDPPGAGDVRDEIERGWRAQEAIDAALARGDLDDDGWYRAVLARLVPVYLAGNNPRAQSGQSGDEAGWEEARGLVVEAIDRDGTFLDVGCASGHLMETAREWAAARGIAVEPYGLDLSPELAALARARLPAWADRIWVGNALAWPAPRRFDFVHLQELSYVPPPRRRALVDHLLRDVCAPGGRLIVGPLNEAAAARATETLVASWGHAIAGRAERPKSARVMRRTFWIDALSVEAPART